MSAGDARELLDTVIAAQLAAIREEAITATAAYIGTTLSIPHLVQHLSHGSAHAAARAIRLAADNCAQARVDEAVGRYRLQLATAEHSPKGGRAS